VGDLPPFDCWFLEIGEKTQGSAGSAQIVETLCGVFVGETLHTFQLDDQHIFDEQVGKVFSPPIGPGKLLQIRLRQWPGGHAGGVP
jgi:hypothetical protein